MDLFKDVIASINSKSENVFETNEEEANKTYAPFVVNKSFSFHLDSILYANEMNKYHQLPKRMQYEFYFNGIDKAKRYGKWTKNNIGKEFYENVEIVAEYYGCSTNKAKQYLNILSEDEVQTIKEALGK